jgi:hypothetical protein
VPTPDGQTAAGVQHGASASLSSGNHATAFEIDPQELGYGRNLFR